MQTPWTLLTLVASLFLQLFARDASAATSWNSALLAYQGKSHSAEALTRAEQAFDAIYTASGSPSDKLRAAEYLLRLDIYTAERQATTDPEIKRNRLEKCWRQSVHRLDGLAGIGETPAAYWKSLCIALWAETFQGLDRIQIISTMRNDFLPAVDLLQTGDLRYAAGGALRILAGFHSNRDANRLRSGSYDAAKAKSEAEQALAVTDGQGATLEGLMNGALRAMVLNSVGERAAAQTAAEEVLAAIKAATEGDDSDPVIADELQILVEQIHSHMP